MAVDLRTMKTTPFDFFFFPIRKSVSDALCIVNYVSSSGNTPHNKSHCHWVLNLVTNSESMRAHSQ